MIIKITTLNEVLIYLYIYLSIYLTVYLLYLSLFLSVCLTDCPCCTFNLLPEKPPPASIQDTYRQMRGSGTFPMKPQLFVWDPTATPSAAED